MGLTRANAAGIGMGPTRAAAGLGRRVPLAFGGADRGGPAVGSPAGCPRGLASSRARGPVASGPGTSRFGGGGWVVSEATRHVMQANKSKDTKPELKVRAALREAGLPGYRLHWKAAVGKPDICYPGRKIAIFVNGCFWHRCPYCALPDPKSNVEFWNAKFARNRARDERDQSQLVAEGWTVLVVWECRLKKGRFEQTMHELVREIRRASGERERAAARGKKAPQGLGTPQPQSQPAPSPRPDLAWPGRGPCVIEIGSLPAWRHHEVAKRLRLRHSMQSQVCSSKRSARAALGPVAPGSHARRRRG